MPEESVAEAQEDDVDIFMDFEDELAASPSAAPMTENWGRGDAPEDQVLWPGEESENEDWNPVTGRIEKK